MKNDQAIHSIPHLFSNENPIDVWSKAADVIRHINPAFDLSVIHCAFYDTVDLFRGNYPGYCAIKTPFHDLQHTLDVFLCAVRLMHGVHISGTTIEDRDITLISIASLMHDVGFAQKCGTETGTGAQFMKVHVRRGIEFMQCYLADRHLPAEWVTPMSAMIQCTDLDLPFNQIIFLNERVRLLGQIVSTADLVGQMADRIYLEKLLFLYEEFKEAKFNGYRSQHDLLCQTEGFYTVVRQRLDVTYDTIYSKLAFHFKDWFGIDRNFYMEAIEKNIKYLSKLTLLDENVQLSMLRRGRIAERIR